MPFFSKDTFREYVNHCKNDQDFLNGWELYERNPEFMVYRKPAHEKSDKLFQYRAIGGWNEVKPTTLAQVYLDLDFRKQWDKNMLGYQYFDHNGNKAIHFEIKYPWPLSNRDYAYVMEQQLVQDENDIVHIVILGESLPVDSFPCSKGTIRIDTYMQNICISPNKNGHGCLIFMDYFDDPKGSIPKSVINWAAKTAVPAFVNSLKNVCLKYQREHPGDIFLDTSDIIKL
ncbi:hypothetical protein RMCBS344292_05865 [Rhizopus microsporus]|nr:hypothetical protein RMCBS344292_03800 [Rhizopus microsporus]CEI91581.1 hypothetical protein RMCBS344292_05865 [Rhizopus microsporus]